MHNPKLISAVSLRARQHIAKALAVGALSLVAAGAAQADATLPGKGTTVQPIQSSIAEEAFQTILVSKALEKLGYTVKAPQETEYATGHVALANGDATFMATHWDPLHADFYRNAGGDDKLWRQGTYVRNSLQGYLIDKKTADQYKITHISQLSDPALAKLFDTNGDGKADLTGCNPGWGCELVIEHQLTAYKSARHRHAQPGQLRRADCRHHRALQARQAHPVLHLDALLGQRRAAAWQGRGLAAGAAFIAARRAGQAQHQAARREGLWLHGQHPAHRGQQGVCRRRTLRPPSSLRSCNCRWRMSTRRTCACAMARTSRQDIERHVNGWIKAHQKTFDGWVAQALAAAR